MAHRPPPRTAKLEDPNCIPHIVGIIRFGVWTFGSNVAQGFWADFSVKTRVVPLVAFGVFILCQMEGEIVFQFGR